MDVVLAHPPEYKLMPDILQQAKDNARQSGGTLEVSNSFDDAQGGFGPAPKFPRPVLLNFLMRYYARTQTGHALDMTIATLGAMALGGIHDQLGGGFHRYSTDGEWRVPHFEKMLYDQAQLAVAYTEAYQATKSEAFASVARDTLDYVLRDMRGQDGGFYSAEDADSVIDPLHPHEKGEGAFYIWTWTELVDALGMRDATIFGARYGVEERGNVDEDPHGEFTGRNILYQAMTEQQVAEPDPDHEPGQQQHEVRFRPCRGLPVAQCEQVHCDEQWCQKASGCHWIHYDRQKRNADNGKSAAERALHKADQEYAGKCDKEGGNGQFHVAA